MAKIICWRSGEVEIVSLATEGAVTLLTGQRSRLAKVLSPLARHGHDGKTLLVPGLPEAADDEAAMKATLDFQERLEEAVTRRRRPAR